MRIVHHAAHCTFAQVKGFWGDIVCSPYFALGIDCDTPNKHAEGLYEIINKVIAL